MKEHIYIAPPHSTYEEMEEAHGPIYDASTLSKIADCPRKHEIRVEENLTSPDDSAPMVAGIAVHYGLEYYYSYKDRGPESERMAIELMRDSYNSFDLDWVNIPEKHAHLTEEHLATIMGNYFDEWRTPGGKRIEIFTPIAGLRVEDLDLSRVLAARFRLNSNDEVVLGESNLVMKFDIDGETLVLAGKPDLPVRDQVGTAFTMDHKSTSQYLSDWWAKSHEVSNKDRGYMAMLSSLLGEELGGSIINAIYVGKYATNPTSKAAKFERFKFDFTPAHVEEALRNQLSWSKTIAFYRSEGYFPQGCGYGGCAHPDLCKRDPDTRSLVKLDPTRYIQSTRSFWDL